MSKVDRFRAAVIERMEKTGEDQVTAVYDVRQRPEFALAPATATRYMRKLHEPKVLRPSEDTALLKSRVHDLELALRQANKEATSAAQVRQYIFGLAEGVPTQPEWVTAHQWSPDSFPGVPSLFLSDLHWGERVISAQIFNANSYDLATARIRLRNVVEKAAGILHTYLSPSKYPGIVVVLGGDMVTGDIHDDLKVTNEKEIMPTVLDCADHLAAALRYLAGEFGSVHVVGVPGNHGRNTIKPRSKFYAETNFDWLIYQLLERYLAGEPITFNCPPARDVTFEVAGRRYRLTHGDQFRGGDGIIGPLGPISRGDMRKRNAAMGMPGQPELYDTLLLGHFHRLIMLPKLIVNGSLKGYDEYAMQNNFEFDPPQQALWITHPRWGINYWIPIIADPDWKKES